MLRSRLPLSILILALVLSACGAPAPAEPAPEGPPAEPAPPAWARSLTDPASVEPALRRAVERMFGLEDVAVHHGGEEIRVAFEQPGNLSTEALMLVYLGVLESAARHAPDSSRAALTVLIDGEPLVTLFVETAQIRRYARGEITTDEYLAGLSLALP